MAISTLSLDSEIRNDDVDDIIERRQESYVEPFWRTRVSQGVLGAFDGVEISYAYAQHPNPIGSIAISSGRIESLIKYKELVYNLYHAGYSVFIHDHRGQGLSGRMTKNTHQGFVRDFDDYVEDFKLFYDKVIVPKSVHKPQLLCHSMGGAIGALYVQKYQTDFSHVAFSAPMFGIRPALPDWLACGIIHLHIIVNAFFSNRPWYFFGQGDYHADTFQQNNLTHSEPRYRILRIA